MKLQGIVVILVAAVGSATLEILFARAVLSFAESIKIYQVLLIASASSAFAIVVVMFAIRATSFFNSSAGVPGPHDSLSKPYLALSERNEDYLVSKDEILTAYGKRWSLSEAENDVALLVIKGFSNREIAAFRASTEGTVKKQLSSVYRKSGLVGRYQLIGLITDEAVSLAQAPKEMDLTWVAETPGDTALVDAPISPGVEVSSDDALIVVRDRTEAA